jgi:L-iditol 2-dehydrogenase
MKRVVLYNPGDLRIEEVEIPKPGSGEVVIRNKVTLTCGTDVKTYKNGYRMDPPYTIGHETAGIVHEVGEGVTKFAVGQRVVAHNSAPCNECYFCKKGQHSMCEDLIQNQFTNGGYAEYQLIPERIVQQNMFHIPDEMSYKQAALTEPFACAVYGIAEVPIELGDTIVVNGCGPIGLMFIRLSYLRGARVIACDLSEERLNIAKKLGAYHTVNISEVKDQLEAVLDLTENRRGVDIAIEAVGRTEVWDMTIRMSRSGGTVMLFGGTKKGEAVSIDTALLHYQQLTIKGVFHTTPIHVNAAFELLKMGAIKAEDFISENEYSIDQVEEAILSHASGQVVKNTIVYS